jgi:hypothetical protein
LPSVKHGSLPKRTDTHTWLGSCTFVPRNGVGASLAPLEISNDCSHRSGKHMFEQLLDSFRRASESTIQGQQQLFKQWLQQWPGAPSATSAAPFEWPQALHEQWLKSLGETLNRQRDLLESSYRKGAQLIEQASRTAEVKSPEDYRRLTEDLWRSFSETLKEQADANVRDFQKAAQRWVDVAPHAAGAKT